MSKKIDFSKLSNAEINIKLKGYEDEYNVKKSQVVSLIHDLEELDKLYINAENELKKRGLLKDG